MPKILTLRPLSDQDINIPSTTGDSHYTEVNEEAADETTYVYDDSQAGWKYDLYGIPDHTTESGPINGVTVFICCYGGHGSDACRTAIKSDSTITSGTSNSPGTTWTTYSETYTTNPADDQPWEWNDIDSLQIGVYLYSYDNKNSDARCTQVYAEVSFNFEAEKSETLALSDTYKKSASLLAKEETLLISVTDFYYSYFFGESLQISSVLTHTGSFNQSKVEEFQFSDSLDVISEKSVFNIGRITLDNCISFDEGEDFNSSLQKNKISSDKKPISVNFRLPLEVWENLRGEISNSGLSLVRFRPFRTSVFKESLFFAVPSVLEIKRKNVLNDVSIKLLPVVEEMISFEKRLINSDFFEKEECSKIPLCSDVSSVESEIVKFIIGEKGKVFPNVGVLK
jgi:hypothetical protein